MDDAVTAGEAGAQLIECLLMTNCCISYGRPRGQYKALLMILMSCQRTCMNDERPQVFCTPSASYGTTTFRRRSLSREKSAQHVSSAVHADRPAVCCARQMIEQAQSFLPVQGARLAQSHKASCIFLTAPEIHPAMHGAQESWSSTRYARTGPVTLARAGARNLRPHLV